MTEQREGIGSTACSTFTFKAFDDICQSAMRAEQKAKIKVRRDLKKWREARRRIKILREIRKEIKK